MASSGPRIGHTTPTRMANLLQIAALSLDPRRSKSQRRGGTNDDDFKEPTAQLSTVVAEEELADGADYGTVLAAIMDDTNDRPTGNSNRNVGGGSIVDASTVSSPKQQRHRPRPKSTRPSLASPISPRSAHRVHTVGASRQNCQIGFDLKRRTKYRSQLGPSVSIAVFFRLFLLSTQLGVLGEAWSGTQCDASSLTWQWTWTLARRRLPVRML